MTIEQRVATGISHIERSPAKAVPDLEAQVVQRINTALKDQIIDPEEAIGLISRVDDAVKARGLESRLQNRELLELRNRLRRAGDEGGEV